MLHVNEAGSEVDDQSSFGWVTESKSYNVPTVTWLRRIARIIEASDPTGKYRSFLFDICHPPCSHLYGFKSTGAANAFGEINPYRGAAGKIYGAVARLNNSAPRGPAHRIKMVSASAKILEVRLSVTATVQI